MDKLQKRRNVHVVDTLFTLALFCVLAATALMVVTIGANVYKGIIGRMDDNFSSSTALTYISNKIRQSDELGGVHLDEVEGSPALVLEKTYNDTVFQTWIYHDGGYLKEVTVRSGDELTLNSGLSIVEVSRFFIEQESDSLLRFTSQDKDGNVVSLLINLRTTIPDTGGMVTIA